MSKDYWFAGGKRYDPADMSESHLMNTINMLERNAREKHRTVQGGMNAELNLLNEAAELSYFDEADYMIQAYIERDEIAGGTCTLSELEIVQILISRKSQDISLLHYKEFLPEVYQALVYEAERRGKLCRLNKISFWSGLVVEKPKQPYVHPTVLRTRR